jgi:hypothetical protein
MSWSFNKDIGKLSMVAQTSRLAQEKIARLYLRIEI